MARMHRAASSQKPSFHLSDRPSCAGGDHFVVGMPLCVMLLLAATEMFADQPEDHAMRYRVTKCPPRA